MANDVRERMQAVAKAVERELPEGWGYFVLAFPFGEGADHRADYVSNAQRKDVLNVMKEFLIRNGAEEDWMKHLE